MEYENGKKKSERINKPLWTLLRRREQPNDVKLLQSNASIKNIKYTHIAQAK